jgi:hypothetical protein
MSESKVKTGKAAKQAATPRAAAGEGKKDEAKVQ